MVRYAAAFCRVPTDRLVKKKACGISAPASIKDELREIAHLGFFHFELCPECICCLCPVVTMALHSELSEKSAYISGLHHFQELV